MGRPQVSIAVASQLRDEAAAESYRDLRALLRLLTLLTQRDLVDFTGADSAEGPGMDIAQVGLALPKSHYQYIKLQINLLGNACCDSFVNVYLWTTREGSCWSLFCNLCSQVLMRVSVTGRHRLDWVILCMYEEEPTYETPLKQFSFFVRLHPSSKMRQDLAFEQDSDHLMNLRTRRSWRCTYIYNILYVDIVIHYSL